MNKKDRTHQEKLEKEHRLGEISDRIEDQGNSYLSDAILGAVDGGVTTFGVIAGAFGGGLGSQVIIILGFAKLISDGFSMAASNFLRTRSQFESLEKARNTERHHIRYIPEGEKQEIRQIFSRKGFEGEILERIVETLSEDEDQWVDIMLSEELGLPRRVPNPLRAAISTFIAFILIGLVPLFPFLLPMLSLQQALWISGGMTAVTFLGVGLLKGLALKQPVWNSGIQTLLTGSGAAALAYVISHLLQQRYGVS
jgi:VIT1/CCC1 family predicted Fe2+/Mn2+ transporter